MLFKNKCGQYVDIVRKNYTSDVAYYIAIMKLKGYEPKPTKPIKLFIE